MPESPITATYSPAARSSETAFSTVRMPNRLVTAASLSTVESYYAHGAERGDRKSTRLNSSHSQISYAVFCLKKKKKHINIYSVNYMINRWIYNVLQLYKEIYHL